MNQETTGTSLDELAEEFLERRRRGEKPTVEEYATAHPELAAEIRGTFHALAMIEDFAPGTSDSMIEASAAQFGPPERRPLEIAQLGDYRIIREVGRGGMGIVYEAEQLSLGRHVALKVLPAAALLDPRHKQRFEREAKPRRACITRTSSPYSAWEKRTGSIITLCSSSRDWGSTRCSRSCAGFGTRGAHWKG